MSQGWQADKAIADQFLPEARRVILLKQPGLSKVRISDDQQDQEEALDLIVDAQRWAWRLRRPDCRWRDLTIRYRRPTGHVTEWAKIMDGYGDYYLYSWTTDDSWLLRRFSEWAVIDLSALRQNASALFDAAEQQRNKDGSSTFLAWPIGVLRDHNCVPEEKMVQPSLF